MKSICHLVLGPNLHGHRRKSKLPQDTHICITQNFSPPEGFANHVMKPQSLLPVETFCAGSGPMDFLSIVTFIEELDKVMISRSMRSSYKLLICGGPNRRSLTNTAFLLGAYMILKLDLKSSYTCYCFRGIDPNAFEPYTDPSSSSSDFHLSIADCWQAIERAKRLSWIDMPKPSAPYRWGLLDADAYAYYNDPLNADMHEIVPGSLFVLRASKRLGGKLYVDK